MKVGAGGVTALANGSYHCTTFELLSLFHLDPLEVGITCFVSVAVLDDNETAEISRSTGESHPAVGGCTNLGSLGRRQVEAFVT